MVLLPVSHETQTSINELNYNPLNKFTEKSHLLFSVSKLPNKPKNILHRVFTVLGLKILVVIECRAKVIFCEN